MKITYKGKTVDVLPPVKRYVNAIERKLHLPLAVRARVMSDVSTGICARHEAGESYEDIMAGMGTPAQVAASLEEEMAEYVYRKSPWRFGFLALAALGAWWVGWCGYSYYQVYWAAHPRPGEASVVILEGVRALTQARVARDAAFTVTAVLLLVVGVAGYLALKRCKPKDKQK